jgi:hypothetical protein
MNVSDGGGETYEGLVEEVGQESATPHHEHFDEALKRAVDATPNGPPKWYKVEAYVYVKHTNPGWVDGYRVTLTPGG